MEKAANFKQHSLYADGYREENLSSDPTHLGHHSASSQASCAQFPLAIFF